MLIIAENSTATLGYNGMVLPTIRHPFRQLVESISRLKTEADVKALFPQLIQAAQAEYDRWQPDEDGFDEELGEGGICHLIADALVDVLNKHGVEATSVSSYHEVHVYAVLRLEGGIFMLDKLDSDNNNDAFERYTGGIG